MSTRSLRVDTATAAALVLLAGTVPAAAQTVEKPGFLLEGLAIQPVLTMSYGHTDNVLQDTTNQKDWRVKFIGGLTANSTWSEHALNASYTRVMTRYQRLSANDTSLDNANLNGRYDFNSNWNVSGILTYTENQIARFLPNATPLAIQGISETLVTTGQLNYGDDTKFTSLVISRIGVENSAAAALSGVTVANSNLDRDEYNYSIITGVKYATWETKPFVYFTRHIISYDDKFDVMTQLRNSKGFQIGGGVTMKPMPTMSLEVRGGPFYQDFNDISLDKQVGWLGLATLNWQAAEDWNISARATRVFNETNIPGSTGFYMNYVSVTLLHLLTKEWSLDFTPAFTNYRLEKQTLSGNNITGTVGLNYRLNPFANLRAEYLRSHQRATLSSFNYDENAFSLSATVLF